MLRIPPVIALFAFSSIAAVTHCRKEIGYMRKYASSLTVIAVFGFLALTASVMSPHDAIAQGSGPRVTIEGPLPLPVTDADRPERTPFRAELCILADYCTQPSSITASADQSIVIDVFSGECSVENAGSFRQMLARLNDTTLHLFIPERAIVGSSHTIYQWNEQTQLRISPNETLEITAAAVGGELAYCRLFFTGYTETA
jgi:hypothetical protein